MIRRLFIAAASCAIFAAAIGWTTGVLAEPRASVPALAVDAVGLTVSDMNRAVRFYTQVLPFRKERDVEVSGRPYELLTGVFGARVRKVRLTLGDEAIELSEFKAPRGREYPADTRANDRWFQHIAIIVSDMDRAYAYLTAHGSPHASTEPQRLPDSNPNAGGIRAYYFRDPDGHFLEVLQFPDGKGDPKWRAAGTLARGSFLGIDHTAIVTGDTDGSLRFYRDLLGMRIVGESLNVGVEQEHLNNVFGVRLRITTLKAPAGPGIELLEYLAPRDGRPTPLDLRANDLAHWETTVVARDLDHLFQSTGRGLYSLVSPEVVQLDAALAGFNRGVLVRDADGHGVRLVER